MAGMQQGTRQGVGLLTFIEGRIGFRQNKQQDRASYSPFCSQAGVLKHASAGVFVRVCLEHEHCLYCCPCSCSAAACLVGCQQVGRQEPVMVLRVDKDKGYIDLSKR